MYVYQRLYIYVYLWISMDNLCVSLCIYVYLCMSMYIYVYLCISMYIYVYIYVYLCICMYIYVYLCMSMYIYIHPCMHACIHSFVRPSAYLPAYARATGDEFPPVFLRGLTNRRSSLHIASTISSRPPAWLLCQVGTFHHDTSNVQHGAHMVHTLLHHVPHKYNVSTTFAQRLLERNCFYVEI